MKLVFANGEHPPVTLDEGVTRIGAAADSTLVLVQPGVVPRHAEIEQLGERVQVRPCAGSVMLNGRRLHDPITLKSGDTLEFGGVRCRLVGAAVEAEAAEVEDRSTRLRLAVPRFVLRGVSGPTFGRSFGVDGTLVLGRQADCDVRIPIGEISRQHARIKPGDDGVLVEDMDSVNGTYINGKRVHSGTLHAGDELALDTVRFMLLAPGAEAVARPAARWRAGNWLRTLLIGVVVLILLLLVARVVGAL